MRYIEKWTKWKRERSSRPEKCSVKKEFLKILKNSSGKHPCKSLFFNEGLRACNFVKKKTPRQVHSCELCDILKNIFFHHWETVSEDRKTEFHLDSMISFMIPFLLILFMNWIRYRQLPFIPGNAFASNVYIEKYMGKWGIYPNLFRKQEYLIGEKFLTERWQNVWPTRCFNYFLLNFLNMIFERRKILLLSADANYFPRKSSIIDVWQCARYASECP